MKQSGGKRSRRRLVWRIARSLLIGYVTICFVLWLLENRIVFPATRYPGGDWAAGGRWGFEDVYFESADGTRLHGWYTQPEQARAYLLYCHGNAGNVTHRAEAGAMLARRYQVGVLLLDYRGYGRSEGSPDEAGVIADGHAARSWLAARAGVPEEAIILLGRSLGGAVAVDLAANGGAKALIVQSTFTSAIDAAVHLYPWLPVRWIMRNRFDSRAKITSYGGPTLVLHGTEDEVIPFVLGKSLFEAANDPKQFVELRGAYHNDPNGEAYYGAVDEFLNPILEAEGER